MSACSILFTLAASCVIRGCQCGCLHAFLSTNKAHVITLVDIVYHFCYILMHSANVKFFHIYNYAIKELPIG